MGTRAGVGSSHHRNPREAAREAASQALQQAGSDRADFVFMFASVGYEQTQLLRAVREATGHAPLTGCSGEGVIAGAEADESNFTVAVMTIQSDEVRFANGLTEGLKQNSEVAGRTMARGVGERIADDTLGLFVFADGLSLNFDRFVRGFESQLALGRHLPLFGGTAADNWAMKRTYQYCDDEISSDGVAWALMSGNARVASAVNHGCIPIGSERTVTRAEGNLIYEIDGKPVLEVLKEYLIGDEVENWEKTVVSLSVGFKAPGYLSDYDEYVIRFMPAKDDEKGAVMLSTEVAEGTSIWMTRRDREKIAHGLDRMADSLCAQLGGSEPKFVLQFDCAGRGKVVIRDQQRAEMLQRLQSRMVGNAPWIGCYTYGEIGPVGQHNCFHNYTAVLAAVY
ncbi:MAG: FIST signal transduction protein [Gemmatimonadaceae bacterium]